MNLQPDSPNAPSCNSVNNGPGDADKVRRHIHNHIYDYLVIRGQQQATDTVDNRLIELAELIEKPLFDAASSLDEYMNLDTLERRLISYLKQVRDTYNKNKDQDEQIVLQENSIIPTSGMDCLSFGF